MQLGKKLVAVVAVLAVAAGVMAQGRRGGFNMFTMSSLVNRDEVKDELKLTDDQKTKIGEIMETAGQKRKDAMQGINWGEMTADDRKKMAESNAKISAETTKDILGVLNADQAKRLREISIQLQGTLAATDPEFQADLKITEDQKTKIAALQQKQMDAMMELFGKMRDGSLDREGMRDAMKKNGEIFKTEVGKILTDDQKAKIKSMSGAPFELKENPGGQRAA